MPTTLDAATGLALAAPPLMERVEVKLPDLVAAYRHQLNGFPTFNIVKRPGEYRIERRLAAQGKDVIDNLRLAGIPEPQLLDVKKTTVAGRQAVSIHIAYRYNEEDLLLNTSVLPINDSYYILTYTDRAKSYQADSSMLPLILNSLTLTAPDTGPQLDRHKPRIVMLLLLGVVLAIIATAWIAYRNRLSR